MKNREAELLERINMLRGELADVKTDYERELTRVQLKAEAYRTMNANVNRCVHCHHFRGNLN